MLPQKILQDLLASTFHLSEADMKNAGLKAAKVQKTVEQYLLDEGAIDENLLYETAAKTLDAPFIALKGRDITKETINLIPAPFANTHRLIAFERDKDTVSIAMLDPEDIQTIEFVRRKTGLTPKVHLTTPTDIKNALRRYHTELTDDMTIEQFREAGAPESGDLKKAAQELPIVNIVNSILEQAVYDGASDIHIEPAEKELAVRYRIDGILHGVMSLPKTVQSGVVARIKILANLKIDEHMVPQDGRFKLKVQEEKLSFRVSIIPVYDGEKIVMRLLPEGQKPLTLDQLGFLPKAKTLVESAIEKPHGMILVTGPTGSGKTTTLYSLLGILNTPDVNICTIEDPIEYHVKGINQSQVNPRAGFTFASGLRSFLRQDPDIIMVGEIRDQETAEVAIHAAMTGHLVLSTLHTNDAPTTIPRLLDMDIPPFLVAFTANIIMAQRLVRKICEQCKKTYTVTGPAVRELTDVFDIKTINTFFKNNSVPLQDNEKDLASMTFFRGEGCSRCGQSGYKGRIGIYEILEVDKPMIEKINSRANAEEIKKYAIAGGMITMLQDGLIKAKLGITTIEEVLRATRD